MNLRDRKGEAGASKVILVIVGAVIVLFIGGILLAGVIGGYIYYSKQPEKPTSIAPAASNSNNIVPAPAASPTPTPRGRRK